MTSFFEEYQKKQAWEQEKSLYFTEMNKLIEGLFELDLKTHDVYVRYIYFAGGPCVMLFNGPPSNKDRFLSAICHDGSYGRDEGLIEIMGLLTDEESKGDEVLGHLTAENVLDRVRKYLKEKE